MVFKRYRLGFFLRILALGAVLCLFAYCVVVMHWYLRAMYVLAVVVFQLYDLFRFAEKVNRDFYTFVSSLANNDYSTSFDTRNLEENTKRLYTLFNNLSGMYQGARFEKEQRDQLLKGMLDQISVGILGYSSDGKISVTNHAFRRFTGGQEPHSIEELTLRWPALYSFVSSIKPGDRKVYRLMVGGELQSLTVHAIELRGEKPLTLVYFQNIKPELEEQEQESWQKLFRVLTHEIMNSITPISSLSNSLSQRARAEMNSNGCFSEKTTSTIAEGLEAMASRSQGLLKFTEAFRQLSRVPEPVLVEFMLPELLRRVESLLQPALSAKEISFSITFEAAAVQIHADAELIEQVFINVIKNAIEALPGDEQPSIAIVGTKLSDGRVEVTVSDNGAGMKPEVVEKAFIPFFTTKEKGSGIGLSLSKQIIRMHGGVLECKSVEGKGTQITIRL